MIDLDIGNALRLLPRTTASPRSSVHRTRWQPAGCRAAICEGSSEPEADREFEADQLAHGSQVALVSWHVGQGRVDLGSLTRRGLDSYLFACDAVGPDYAVPVVVPRLGA